MKINLYKLLPHFIAFSVFLILTFIQYFPVIQGKVVKQNDVLNYRGAAKESEDFFVRTGKWPLWTNSMFSGMPAYQVAAHYPANLFNHVYQKLTIGFGVGNFTLLALISFYILLLSLNVNWLLSIGGSIMYAFSTYFFIIIHVGHNSKTMALALLPLVVAGVLRLYGGRYLSGIILTGLALPLALIANHVQMIYYFFISLLIFAVIKFFFAWKENDLAKFFKASAILCGIGIVSVLSNITLLWMTYEYGKYSTRGESELTLKDTVKTSGLDRDYALKWSYGLSETLNLLVPNFSGSGSETDIGTSSELYKHFKLSNSNTARQLVKKAPTYWGSQPFTDGPFYLGAVTCFFFILGLFQVKGHLKWWLVISVSLAILLAWGKNFAVLSDLFLYYFPLYNKFRAVASILVIAMFAVPLLAILGLQNFMDTLGANNSGITSAKRKNQSKESIFTHKPFFYALLITGGIILVILLLGQWLFDFSGMRDEEFRVARWPIDLLKKDRISLMKSDGVRSLLFLILTILVLVAYWKKWLKKEIATIAIAILILSDQWLVGRRYLNNESFVRPNEQEYSIQPTRADLQILKQEIIFNPRIPEYAWTLTGKYLEWKKTDYPGQEVRLNRNDSVKLQFMAMNKLTNFRVLNTASATFNESRTSYFHKSIGGYHGAKLERYQELIDFHIMKNNRAVWNMLNAKYFIVKDQNNNPVAQRNQEAMGPGWFVMGYRLVANADSEITALKNFNPVFTAVVDNRFKDYLQGLSVQYDPENTVVINEYDLENIQYTSRAKTEQLAVFSEIFFDKGWKAFIDGNPVPHIRVNYVLRAMRIPAGEHKIEFRFYPDNYYRCEKISFTGSLTLLMLCLGGITFYLVRKGKAVL